MTTVTSNAPLPPESAHRRLDIDVVDLPRAAFHSGSLIWWGVSGMVVIEGTMFALCFATYFYLQSANNNWPPPTVLAPTLSLSSIGLAILVLSCIPMHLAAKRAEAGDEGGTKLMLALGIVMGLAFLWMQVLSWRSLNYRWDSHSYGSINWTMLILHTGHVLASTVETMVLLALAFAKPLDGHLRKDIEVDGLYWYFITIAWIPIYIIIYVLPHFHGKYVL
jgi:cytochrome c oxidase subunit 3